MAWLNGLPTFWALPDTPTALQFAPCTSQVLGLAAHDVRAPRLLLTLPLAFHLAHRRPRWHDWRAPGSWFSPPPWTQRSCLHFCAVTQEEFLPFYLSICGTTAPQKAPEKISRAPRAWWAPNSSHGNSCSFWVLLGARRAGDGSRQLEGVPYLRTAHTQHPGASQEPDSRVLPRRSSGPPVSMDLRKLACSLPLRTDVPRLGCQACWRPKMSTTSPGLQLKASDAQPGTGSQDVSCDCRFPVTRERETGGKGKKSLLFLAKSFSKLIVSALGTRH